MDDLIKRQDAITAYCEHECGIKGMTRENCGATDCGTIFDDIPSAQPQWTPCSESLPEENEMVLISAKYIGHLSNNAPYVEEGFFKHDGWYSAYGDNYSELLAKVIAWMPLPEPYKGE